MSAKAIAELLQIYGGWGLSTILMAAIVALYLSSKKEGDKASEQFISLLKECSALLRTLSDGNTRVEDLLRRVETQSQKADESMVRVEKCLEKTERILDRVEHKLHRE